MATGKYLYIFPTSCTREPRRKMVYEKCELVVSRSVHGCSWYQQEGGCQNNKGGVSTHGAICLQMTIRSWPALSNNHPLGTGFGDLQLSGELQTN